MSENTDVADVAADALHSAVDNASKLPASSSAPSDRHLSAPHRLFNRDKSVHQLLGGGQGEILVALMILVWSQVMQLNLCVCLHCSLGTAISLEPVSQSLWSFHFWHF
jgi:hypothetical protein